MHKDNESHAMNNIRRPDSRQSFTIPVRLKLPHVPLITVKVPDNINFKKESKTSLALAGDIKLGSGGVVLDWFPRVALKTSKGVKVSNLVTNKKPVSLTEEHLAFMDFDAIYLQLQQLKAERSWHNLNLGRGMARALLTAPK